MITDLFIAINMLFGNSENNAKREIISLAPFEASCKSKVVGAFITLEEESKNKYRSYLRSWFRFATGGKLVGQLDHTTYNTLWEGVSRGWPGNMRAETTVVRTLELGIAWNWELRGTI